MLGTTIKEDIKKYYEHKDGFRKGFAGYLKYRPEFESRER